MMKGSAKGRYGLQFMVDLALQAGRGPVLVDAIAERQALPAKFLRVLLGARRQLPLCIGDNYTRASGVAPNR